MRYMLDTNILIYIIKRKPPSVIERFSSCAPDDELMMSFVTYAELLKGATRSTQRQRVEEQLASLCQLIPVSYMVTPLLAQRYAEHAARLKSLGTPIGNNDLWIAAHALSLNCVLVTHNTKEFNRIEGLKIEDWVVPEQ